MGFQANAREAGPVIVIDASGRLTLGAGGTALLDTVHILVSKGHRRFLLNFAAVEFIDSYGIGELVRCQMAARKHGGEVRLLRPPKVIDDLLQICKVDMLFEIHPDEPSALAAFR